MGATPKRGVLGKALSHHKNTWTMLEAGKGRVNASLKVAERAINPMGGSIPAGM
jgi:hypothetical protein